MSDSIVEKYFRSQQSSLFKWTDSGRELAWLDGTTVSFHGELAVVLNRLARGSLPGLSSVVVAVAATRSTWPIVAGRITRLVRALQNSNFPSYADAMKKHRYLTDTWPASVEKLNLLCTFARTEATTPEKRAELLATLFDRFESGYSEDEQLQLAAAFEAGLPDHWMFERKGDGEPISLPSTDEEEAEWRARPPLFHRILHDVLDLLRIARVLASSLHDYNAGDLQRRVRTGVAVEIVAPEESPLDRPGLSANLLDSLRDDPELSGFARLTRYLMGAVSLPRSLDSSFDIPTGGVSDISNRGQLDKLLLSELAFDDLTLAVRIASNEAMYIRRESPPNPKAESRAVLIDNCLPMWGIPKLYATAMAMALSAGTDKRVQVNCYRPDGPELSRVSLTSRDDIAEQLASLSTVEHSGSALPAFEEVVQPGHNATEPVLITTDDVLQCPEFKRALERSSLRTLWIIAVERDGQLNVIHRTPQGTSIRKRIHLPLKEILSRPVKALSNPTVSEDLPDILRRSEFPLRLSHQLRRSRVFAWGNDFVALSDDGRMLIWSANGLGAKQICDDLPRRAKTEPHLLSRDESAIRFLVHGESTELVTLSRLGMHVTRVQLADVSPGVTDACSIGSTIFVFGLVDNHPHVVAYDEMTGRKLSSSFLSKTVKRHARCITSNKHWGVLSVVGNSIVGEELPKPVAKAKDVIELEGGQYLYINSAGQLFDSQDPTRFQLFRNLHKEATRLFGYLPGSRRVGVAFGEKKLFLDLHSGRAQGCDYAWSGGEDFELMLAQKALSRRTPRWKFRRIGIDSNAGTLVLQSASGAYCLIHCLGSKQRMELKSMPSLTTRCSLFDFEDCAGPAAVGYRLQVATIAGIGTAWLDSRGLLHLKSHNSAYPQISFAMQEGALSGWLSTGEVFGDDYYIGRPDESSTCKRITPQMAWESAVKPFIGVAPWTFQYS